MDKADFETERKYQTGIAFAKMMLCENLITWDEYTQIDTMLLKKYRPTLSMLLSGKDLIN